MDSLDLLGVWVETEGCIDGGLLLIEDFVDFGLVEKAEFLVLRSVLRVDFEVIIGRLWSD